MEPDDLLAPLESAVPNRISEGIPEPPLKVLTYRHFTCI